MGREYIQLIQYFLLFLQVQLNPELPVVLVILVDRYILLAQ
jgi:hypothetical protein